MDHAAPSHSWSPAELQSQLEVARNARAFLVFRTGDGRQRLLELDDAVAHVTIGRGEGCDLVLDQDEQVSGLHAELLRIGPEWVISDDGLSRNGSFVNSERVVGRRRLRDGDAVRIGSTHMLYRGAAPRVAETMKPDRASTPPSLTPTQQRILAALCRPYQRHEDFPIAPTNLAIAAEVSLSVDRVKAHLRALYELFGVDDLPHNQKRVRLAELVVQSGLIARREP